MLSDREIERIRRQLENQITGNARRRLKKKLIEHHYATHLHPFTPFPHHHFYLNRFTNDQTLREIIDAAEIASRFTLDTESVNVFQQPNRPALIQIQILRSDEPSFVLILEINHLPLETSETFQQIRHLCRIVLDSRKKIFIWGSIDELQSFLPFRLFTSEQIALSDNDNLQEMFQEKWQKTHVHQLIECVCEQCLGKLPTNTWSLQDAVAHQLHEWLDKRHTQSTFDIGLDPAFNRVDPEQRRLREQLSEYAMNDCLAMEKLLANMPQRRSSEMSPTSTNYSEHIRDIDEKSITGQRHVSFLVAIPSDSPTNLSAEIDHPTQLTNSVNSSFDRNKQTSDSSNETPSRCERIITISAKRERAEDQRSVSNDYQGESNDQQQPNDFYRSDRTKSIEETGHRINRASRIVRFNQSDQIDNRTERANEPNDRSKRRNDSTERPEDRFDGTHRFCRIVKYDRQRRIVDEDDRRTTEDRPQPMSDPGIQYERPEDQSHRTDDRDDLVERFQQTEGRSKRFYRSKRSEEIFEQSEDRRYSTTNRSNDLDDDRIDDNRIDDDRIDDDRIDDDENRSNRSKTTEEHRFDRNESTEPSVDQFIDRNRLNRNNSTEGSADRFTKQHRFDRNQWTEPFANRFTKPHRCDPNNSAESSADRFTKPHRFDRNNSTEESADRSNHRHRSNRDESTEPFANRFTQPHLFDPNNSTEESADLFIDRHRDESTESSADRFTQRHRSNRNESTEPTANRFTQRHRSNRNESTEPTADRFTQRHRSNRNQSTEESADRTTKEHRFDRNESTEESADPVIDRHRLVDRQHRIADRTDLRSANNDLSEQLESAEAKKKRHNRACTIKQRKRNYRTEIIRRRIDRRFSITLAKEILRRYGVPFTAINITTSSITGDKSLYIGLRDTSNVHQHEVRTRNLFTTEFFNEFRARHRQ